MTKAPFIKIKQYLISKPETQELFTLQPILMQIQGYPQIMRLSMTTRAENFRMVDIEINA